MNQPRESDFVSKHLLNDEYQGNRSRRAHFRAQTYAALSGPTGQPQSASDAIDKLADRLANSENPEDRRTALLGVKGLGQQV